MGPRHIRNVSAARLFEPWIRQADCVDHAARELTHTKRWIAFARRDAHGLGAQPTNRGQIHHIIQLGPETGGARRQQHWISKLQAGATDTQRTPHAMTQEHRCDCQGADVTACRLPPFSRIA